MQLFSLQFVFLDFDSNPFLIQFSKSRVIIYIKNALIAIKVTRNLWFFLFRLLFSSSSSHHIALGIYHVSHISKSVDLRIETILLWHHSPILNKIFFLWQWLRQMDRQTDIKIKFNPRLITHSVRVKVKNIRFNAIRLFASKREVIHRILSLLTIYIRDQLSNVDLTRLEIGR